MAEQLIGTVVHQWQKPGPALLALPGGGLSGGDTIRIKGQTTDFTHTIDSMQLDGETVEKAKKGQSVGVKVSTRARRTDSVFKIAD